MGVNFVGPINHLGKRIRAPYIITAIDYLTRLVEAAPVIDCIAATAARFIFQNIVTCFGCPHIPMSDQDSHYVNQTIKALTEEFQVQHKRSTPYHPQENGTIEAFNKILETVLTKVCNDNHDDLDLKIPAVLWAYRTTCKSLIGQTQFKLVYGQQAVIPMEYTIPSLRIYTATDMDDVEALEENATQLIQLEEDRFITSFQQQVAKD